LRCARRRRTHPRGQLAHADQLEHASREHEGVAGNEPRDEAFFDVAERLSVAQLHGDARLGNDRPDADPVPTRDARIGYARDAIVADDDAAVLGIGVERGAAVDDEVERELPLLLRELAIRMSASDLR